MRLCLLSLLLACAAGDRGELIGPGSGGYIAPAAAKPTPQPKPRIPTLVYYPYNEQYKLRRVYEEEIGFNDDNKNDYYFSADMPDSFQYSINCNSKGSINNPWIPDTVIEQTISTTTCKTLLSTGSIRIRIQDTNPYVFNVNLVPVPQIQSWNGYTLASIPGTPSARISDCCDATVCKDRCLEKPQAQRCHLEFNILETLRRVVAWGPLTESYAIGLKPVFRIPCDYCQLKDCVRECSNGEFATGYSDYQV